MTAESARARGTVVVCSCRGGPDGHESLTQAALARRLAAIKGYEFAGHFDPDVRYGCPLYFVPGDTLIEVGNAHSMGIRGEHDLFGAVVPFQYVATKTITHPLPADTSRAPPGWSAAFTRAVRDVVLPGFSAFAPDDVRLAGMRLLEQGPIRLKKASGVGGSGQTVVTDENELEDCIRSYDTDELLRDGVVVEQNLGDVVTFSVGQVRVGTLLATYYGTQQLATDNGGKEVYGGSRLIVVRGNFDALQQVAVEPEVQTAIAQARTYHAAAFASFPGMFASRSNYDIAQGRDDDGRLRSGVLEQSWRIGGASGAEILALEAFQQDPGLDVICASTTEVYGENPSLPADATIYFQGVDETIGPLTKYSKVEAYANP